MSAKVLVAIFIINLVNAGSPQRRGPNEEYLECGPNCDRTCATLYDECDIVYKRCPSGYYCIDRYARDDHGICIPIEKCPRISC